MNETSEFEKIPTPFVTESTDSDDKDYQVALLTDKEHQQQLEQQKQNIGWLGRFLGRSTDTQNFGRDVIIAGLIVIAITITHIIHPEQSALIPALTGLLGFVGGTRYRGKI